MGTINVLPRHLVNKIAAGEVIERPASVVKELVENTLDAGATRIEVAVEDGGKKSISVRDDGAGMAGDDLALAFRPHATSKITSEQDLTCIATMGFRGEALASIASISHAHIRSRRRDAADAAGNEIHASGETMGELRPCPAAAGTTVTIRDLFFNTPARRKFLRTTNTELGHVTDQMTRLALPHPKVAFVVTHNGREIMNLPPVESTLQRARDLFGGELAESLLPVAPRRGKIGIDGLIGPPAGARASGKWQFFFLNGRYIRDRLLSHALREAYRGRLEPSRWPVAILFIELPPEEVDVNVHPTKIEVRFHDGQLVHGELLAALKQTLNQADLTPAAAPQITATPDQPASPDVQERRDSLRQALADFFKSAPPPQPRLSFPHAPSHSPPRPRAQPDAASPAAPAAPAKQTENLPAVIQLNNSYIVAAEQDSLIIVDQHALHERLIYNDLKRRLGGPEGAGLTAQRMLIPCSLTVTPAEAATLEAHRELLGRLGVEVVPFGPDAVAVQRFPVLLAERGVSPEAFIRDTLDALVEDETACPERLLEAVLEVMACKAAVKAGELLSEQEMSELLARRQDAEKGSSCPHGRPTTLKLTIRDLEKGFKRS